MLRVFRLWKIFGGNITDGAMNLSQDFKEFIQSLNENNVRPANLRRNKQASGRAQDLADLENLE